MQPVAKRYERYIYPVLFILLDYAAILAAEYGALGITDAIDPRQTLPYHIGTSYMYGWIPLIYIIFLGRSRAYREMQPMLDTIRSVFHSVGFGAVTTIVILYFVAPRLLTSRIFLVLDFLLMLLFIYAVRVITCVLLKKLHLFYVPVILIGAGHTAEHVLRFFHDDLGYRYDVLGIIDDAPISNLVRERFLLYGNMDQAAQIIKDTRVQQVIICAPGLEKDKLTSLIEKIQPLVRNISFIPDLIGAPMSSVEPQMLYDEQIMMLTLKNNLARRRNRIYKRAFDLIATISGGLLISPILLAIAVANAIRNHGHVFFAHRRIGKNGKEFYCYKFQSMVPDAEAKLEQYLKSHPEARKEWEETFKLTNDPRVTKLGAFLRKTSLDELPQLWNVIKGDMSLVGPRPIVKKEIPRYGEHFKEYCSVLPGITGMWQASGRSDTTYAERVAMDTWYVHNWSVWLDIMYLAKTFSAVIHSKGAY